MKEREALLAGLDQYANLGFFGDGPYRWEEFNWCLVDKEASPNGLHQARVSLCVGR
jgi:hypothetical protein